MNVPVADLYNLGNVLEIIPVPQKPDFLIVTSSGKYTLHTLRYPSWTQRIHHDHTFTEYLAQHGYPARRIIPTYDGNIVCKAGDTSFFLTEYFDSSSTPTSLKHLSKEQLMQAGFWLAELHKLSEQYQGPRSQRIPFRAEKSYTILSSVAEHLSTKYKKDEFDDLSMEAVKRQLAYIRKNPFEKEHFMSLPRITNHGDYHAGNIVFDTRSRIIAVLDFEFCTEMPRVWDIAWAMSWLCREKATEGFCGRMNTANLEPFLSSYNETYPLSPEEQIDLNSIGISACLHSTYFLSHYHLGNKSPYELEKCQDIEEWFWWANNANMVQEVILQSCKNL